MREHAFHRIDRPRELLALRPALRLVLRQPPRRRKRAPDQLVHRHRAREKGADVAIDVSHRPGVVGARQVGDHLAHFLGRLRAIHRQQHLHRALEAIGVPANRDQRAALGEQARVEVGEDRAVTGAAHLDHLIVHLAAVAHLNVLFAHGDRTGRGGVGDHLIRVGGIDLLDQQIHHVGDGAGDPPGDAIVVTGEDVRQAGHGDADHVQVRRLQVQLHHHRGQQVGEVGIVGDQRLATDGVLAVDDPGVRSAHHRQRVDAQPLSARLATQPRRRRLGGWLLDRKHPLELGRDRGRQRPHGRSAGQRAATRQRLVRIDLLGPRHSDRQRQQQAGRLLGPVVRDAPDVEQPDRERVGRIPGRRLGRHQPILERLVFLDRDVHSVGERP